MRIVKISMTIDKISKSLIVSPPSKKKRGPTSSNYPKPIIERTNIRYNKHYIIQIYELTNKSQAISKYE